MVAVKIGLVAFSPFTLAGLRFMLGGGTILGWALLQRIPLRITTQEILPHLINTVIFILEISTMNFGVHYTLAAHSSVLFYIYPFLVAFFARFFFPEERLSWRKVSGMLLAFGGVLSVFAGQSWGDTTAVLVGDLLILLSALLLAVQTIYIKKIARRIAPLHIVLWQCFLGVPAFFVLGAWWGQGGGASLSWAVVIAIFYQGAVVAGFCFLAWTILIRDYSPSWVSSFFMSTPLFGVALSMLLLGEPLSWNLLLGAGLVAGGLYIITRPEKQRKKLEEEKGSQIRS